MKQVSKFIALAVLATPLLAVAQPVAPRLRTASLHDRAPRLHDRAPVARVNR